MNENPPNAQAAESPEEKRARLQIAKEKLEKLREKKDRDMKDAVLELELRLEGEIGPRGEQFEIVETIEGPVAVRLGEGVLQTRFTASKVTEADVHDFVFPCVVFPEKTKYLEMVARRPDVANRCAHALMTLYGTKHKDDSGKF